MNVKLIAVDMDGTFLTNNNEYDQEDQNDLRITIRKR